MIDSHHALPEDYEFEYGATDHWSLSEQGIYELLQALFARFRDQLEVSDGRRRIERRYGEKGRDTLATIIYDIDQALEPRST